MLRRSAYLAIAAFAAWVPIALGLTGCGDERLTRDELLDPDSCRTCHPQHYREWSGSMHAYASTDPLFLAFNARGQRETGGALGDFCVRCHAPMARLEGATTDGLNLPDLPRPLQGVTCYFCHLVDAVEGTHNNPLRLATDGVLRGGLPNPTPSPAHASAYSPLHDRAQPASASLCGSCHDIVTQRGVHLERTYLEWQQSLYAKGQQGQLSTCNRCHLPGRSGLAAEQPGVPLRRVSDHSMAAVDVALVDFPERDAQRALVQRELDHTLLATLCVTRVMRGMELRVDLENVAAGHSFTSGATHDRRVWLELVASLGGRTVFQTGVLADGERLLDLEEADPNLWRIGDRVLREDGTKARAFWEVARYESELLLAPTAPRETDPGWRPTHKVRVFTVPTVADRVTMRVRLQPVGLDVLDHLIEGGDLSPELREKMPTFDLGSTVLEWTPERGSCVPEQ
jgi:hypothetical protein